MIESIIYFQQEQDSEQDTCTSKDGIEEILSAFPNNYLTQVVSVTTDSEDDSNKGDSLNSTFKTTEESSTENDPSPLNIMDDHDEIDAGEQMLSYFPQSECPVIVDIAANDSVTHDTGKKVVVVSEKGEDDSSADERTSANNAAAAADVSATDTVKVDHQGAEDVSDTDKINADQTKMDSLEETPDQEIGDRPVKRTGSFRLINNNGVLKVIDSGETSVKTETVKEARLLKTRSLKAVSTDCDDEQSLSDSTEARKQLGNTVSEAKALDKEFQNVYKDIATLGKMIDVEGVEKTVESENKGNNGAGDVVDGEQDAGAVIISVNSMTSADQRPKINLEGVTTSESTTDEQEGSARQAEINGGIDETDVSSSGNTKKQRPKRLMNTKRYSLGTESALLSPEDDNHVELTNFGSSNSIKSDESAASSTSDSQTDMGKVSTDGQQPDEVTPSPPPRQLSGRHKTLNYSASFNQPGEVKSNLR